jgi:hypothetical protein
MSEKIRMIDLVLDGEYPYLRCGCGWRYAFGGERTALINMGVLMDVAASHRQHDAVPAPSGGWEIWA